MAQLTVRNLDDGLVELLEERAASRGHSVEEEHRQILQAALQGRESVVPAASPSRGLAQHLTSIPDVGHGEDFDRHLDDPRPVDL
jgi:plasmid stability protein